LFIEDPENKPFFGMKKDVAIVERNFINFVDTLAKLHNLPTTYDAQGRFTPEAQTLLDKYLYDNNPNNPVRALAQQANIAIDEDTPALLRLYLVANHQRSRKKVNQSTGADELISLNEAFTWARTQNPEYFKVQEYRQEPASGPKAAAVSPDAIERGIQSRKQFAPEPKNILSEPNIGDVGQAEFLRLLSKPTGTYTAQEEEFVRKALKTYANFSDEEVGNFFKLPQHP
jgi:hypothetical protein